MKRCALISFLLAASMLWQPADASSAFQFGVIGHSFKVTPDDAILKRAIGQASQAELAFVVATGIKANTEACSDKLYNQRKNLLDASAAPIVLSLAASDWSACRNTLGRSNAIERLSRLREVFFPDPLSLGGKKIPLTRLSSSPEFRSYAENAHWEVGHVLFATVNLPANNNHFLSEAGRNSEYEDRLVANRAWLKRLFALAQRKKLDGIVLFSDGNIGLPGEENSSLLPSFNAKQDGFTGVRRQIRALAKKYAGKVLLIDAQEGATLPHILWRDNVGHVSVSSEWATIQVAKKHSAPLFEINSSAPDAIKAAQRN